MTTSEEPHVPSKMFAPAGSIATKEEKELEAQWEAYRKEHGIEAKGVSH